MIDAAREMTSPAYFVGEQSSVGFLTQNQAAIKHCEGVRGGVADALSGFEHTEV
jgi:hypothetical protein